MSNKKIRKTLNISLQSKKYSEPINKIINKWEEDGSNISVEVCDTILLFDKLDRSIVLSNVKNIFELIQKIVGMYYNLDTPEANKQIEELLSMSIIIDNSKLSSALSLLNKKVDKSSRNKDELDEKDKISNDKNFEEIENNSFKERPIRKSVQQESNYRSKSDNDNDNKNKSDINAIPFDFLINS